MVKNTNGKCFLIQDVKKAVKNKKLYSIGLRCRVFKVQTAEMVDLETVGHDTVRVGLLIWAHKLFQKTED